MIHLHTLGRCAIETDASVITPRAPILFALGLKLLMHPGRRTARSTMLATFWPTVENETASRKFLRKNLCDARARGLRIHGTSTDELWVSPDEVRTDIDYIATESVETLLARDYTILPGYTPDHTWQVFSDNVDDFRQRIHRQVIDGLTIAMEREKASGEWRAVQQVATLLLELDESHARANELHARSAKILRRQRVPESALHAYERHDHLYVTGSPTIQIISLDQPEAYHGLAVCNTPLRGRKQDLAALTNSFLNAARTRSSTVYLHGDAGIGKSRLIREFIEIIKADGAEAILTTCEPEYINQPLAPFVSLVPQLLRIAGSDLQSPWTQYLTSLLCPSDTDFSYTSSAKAEIPGAQDRLQHAIRDLIDSASRERPLVVIVENVHWCHKASWLLLAELSFRHTDTEREQLFIFTTREPWHEDVLGVPPTGLRIQHLNRLDSEASEHHIREYLTAAGRSTNNDLIRWWVDAGEGNPYFNEELVNHWIVTGESFHAPPSLTAVVNARLSRLSPQAIHVLQACAVLSEHASVDRILRLLGSTRTNLLTALDELDRAGMLKIEYNPHLSNSKRIACRHDILAAQALHRLTAMAKTLLHTGVGTMLEADLNVSPSAALLWSCSEHWHQADNAARAVVLGLACARHLWQLNLTGEAISTCRKTLKYCIDDESRYRVLRTLAYMLYRRSEWNDIFVVLAGARRLQCSIAPQATTHDDLELLALDAAWHAERSWRVILEAAVRCAATTEATPGHRVQAATIALKIATNLGDIPLMHQIYELTRHLCEDSQIPLMERLTFEMIYHAICGDSQQCFEAAQALAGVTPRTRQGIDIEALPVLLNCGSAFVRAGFGENAVAIFKNVFEYATQLGVSVIARQAASRLLIYYLDVDNTDLAEHWADKCTEIDYLPTALWHHLVLAIGRARIAVSRQLYDEADTLLGSAANAAWNVPIGMLRSSALATKVCLEVGRGTAPELIEPFVHELAIEHEMHCEMGSHDFEAFALYIGFQHLGASEAARQMLAGYTRRRRRNNVPPRQDILNAVKREAEFDLGLNGESQFRNFLSMWQ